MEIHQVVVSASAGDAITNEALELRELIRRVCPSEVYACHRDPAVTDDVRPLSMYDARANASPADVLVVHYSIGDAQLRRFLRARTERIVVLYHNITPARYFADYSPEFARLLTAGRADLSDLGARVTLALAVSEYDADDLRGLGFRDVRVSPFVFDPRRLRATPPVEAPLATGADGPVVLSVGQLLPHKRPDLLIEAYHVLVTKLVPEATLVLVGNPRLQGYYWALRQLVRELNLPGVRMTGPVSDAQLAAWYRRADVFATASEHEGLCVPLLEAMTFDVPVVARSRAAIPDTVGDAAVLLPCDADALLLAEAIAEVVENRALRSELVARGRRRVTSFDAERARAAFLEHLLEVA